MKNGKDRNVYDVMNDVNVDIETMDMSDEEKDACVKRLRHKVKATYKKTGEEAVGTKITIKMAKDEGWYSKPDKYGKETSKWQTMPQQMLAYRAAA